MRGLMPIDVARDVATLASAQFSSPHVVRSRAQAKEVHSYLSQIAAQDVLSSDKPVPAAIDQSGRSAQRFVVGAVMTRGQERCMASVWGRDINAVTTSLIGEARERLLRGKYSAARIHTPGQASHPNNVLAVLGLGYFGPEFLVV